MDYLKEFHLFSVTDEILPLMMEHIDDISIPIVSVGSGCGHLEASLIHHSNGLFKFITVDPYPYSFYVPGRTNDKTMMPQFASVQQLIGEKPSIVGNNVLLLAWSTPIDSIYDFEAIKLMKPKKIICIYELLGGAGGNKFHGFLSTINNNLSKNPSMIVPSVDELTQINKYQPLVVHKKYHQPDPNNPHPQSPSNLLRWGILACAILDSSVNDQCETKTLVSNQPNLNDDEFASKVF